MIIVDYKDWDGGIYMRKEIKNMEAFSLLELLIVLALTSIVTSIGVISLTNTMKAWNRISAEDYLMYDVRKAQNVSIAQGCRGVMTVDADAKGYSFGSAFLLSLIFFCTATAANMASINDIP